MYRQQHVAAWQIALVVCTGELLWKSCPFNCNRILRRNKSHKFCLIWSLATCCCDQILSQRRRFWQKYPNTHEAICRCDVSPRHVTSTCRLVRTDLNCRCYLSRKNILAFRSWTPLACSRLRDSGEKSFSRKKCEKSAGAGERQGGSHFSRRHHPHSQVACVLFSLCSF